MATTSAKSGAAGKSKAKAKAAARPGAKKPVEADAPVRGIEERLVDAALALAAERPWDDVPLADIADRAGLPLADLHPDHARRGQILAAFSRRIDATLLAEDFSDLAAEPARDRLFDVLMRRFDLLVPYREGLRSIARALSRDPVAALGQAPALDRAMAWALEAAGISASGWRGRLRVRGLGLAWLAAFRIWLDDGPDQARTMAELDRQLSRLDLWARRIGLGSGAGSS